MASASSGSLISVDYEVFGRVQGVFFRKFTHETATKLGLVGRVKNTAQGTVTGTVQGSADKIKIMKEWLAKTGSPRSRIDNCVFRNESSIPSLAHTNFVIDRPPRKKKSTRTTKPR